MSLATFQTTHASGRAIESLDRNPSELQPGLSLENIPELGDPTTRWLPASILASALCEAEATYDPSTCGRSKKAISQSLSRDRIVHRPYTLKSVDRSLGIDGKGRAWRKDNSGRVLYLRDTLTFDDEAAIDSYSGLRFEIVGWQSRDN